MHILGLSAVADSEAHSQGRVLKNCEHKHTASEMMSTFNNSFWSLDLRIGHGDKDGLTCCVGNFEFQDIPLTLQGSWYVFAIGSLQKLHIAEVKTGHHCVSSNRSGNFWVSLRQICVLLMSREAQTESHRSNTIIAIRWVWVTANLSWLRIGLFNLKNPKSSNNTVSTKHKSACICFHKRFKGQGYHFVYNVSIWWVFNTFNWHYR